MTLSEAERKERKRQRDAIYRAANRERRNELTRQWRLKNPGATKRYKEKNPDYFSAWQKKNSERMTALRSRSRLARMEKLAGRPRPTTCEVCGHVPDPNGSQQTRVLHWDHDHETGIFRGWICNYCNATLGHVRDNPEVLRKLADYIENARRA